MTCGLASWRKQSPLVAPMATLILISQESDCGPCGLPVAHYIASRITNDSHSHAKNFHILIARPFRIFYYFLRCMQSPWPTRTRLLQEKISWSNQEYWAYRKIFKTARNLNLQFHNKQNEITVLIFQVCLVVIKNVKLSEQWLNKIIHSKIEDDRIVYVGRLDRCWYMLTKKAPTQHFACRAHCPCHMRMGHGIF